MEMGENPLSRYRAICFAAHLVGSVLEECDCFHTAPMFVLRILHLSLRPSHTVHDSSRSCFAICRKAFFALWRCSLYTRLVFAPMVVGRLLLLVGTLLQILGQSCTTARGSHCCVGSVIGSVDCLLPLSFQPVSLFRPAVSLLSRHEHPPHCGGFRQSLSR